jgi:hypothetical protein
MKEARRRRGRETPARVHGELQPRDVRGALAALARLRAGTLLQLQVAGGFPDRTTTARRTSVLQSHGLVRVTVAHQNAPNIYTLTAKGLALLEREGIDVVAPPLPRAPEARALAHILGIGDVRIAFEQALSGVGAEGGLTIYSDHELRHLAREDGAPYIPDLLVAIEDRGASFGWNVEVDLAEESCAFFARTKGEAIAKIAAEGASMWGISTWSALVLTTSEVRLRNLAIALQATAGARLWFGTTDERVRDRGILGPSWVPMDMLARLPRGGDIPWRELVATGAPR